MFAKTRLQLHSSRNTCRFGPLTLFALLLRLRKGEKERERERKREKERKERERERKRGDINHLSVHQWLRSAIRDSQQPSATALCGTTGRIILKSMSRKKTTCRTTSERRSKRRQKITRKLPTRLRNHIRN